MVLRADVERLVPNELLDVVAVLRETEPGFAETLWPPTTLLELDTVSWREPLYTPLLEPLPIITL